jgi:hypothetical protein
MAAHLSAATSFRAQQNATRGLLVFGAISDGTQSQQGRSGNKNVNLVGDTVPLSRFWVPSLVSTPLSVRAQADSGHDHDDGDALAILRGPNNGGRPNTGCPASRERRRQAQALQQRARNTDIDSDTDINRMRGTRHGSPNADKHQRDK